jgi:YHYH protein
MDAVVCRCMIAISLATGAVSCGGDGGDGGVTVDANQIDAATGPAICGLTHDELNSSPKIMANSTYKWTCGTARVLVGNGIPDHPVVNGSFATQVSAQNINVSFPLAPTNTNAITGDGKDVGYAINSVKLDPATAGTCASTATGTGQGNGCVLAMGTDPWRIEALGGAFIFGVDENNAHTQPNGQYHYHGMPVGIVTKQNRGMAMTLVAFARDGFPIYARYGYSDANDSGSAIKIMAGSWQKKATPDSGRPAVSIFPMGTFTEDYEYVAGSGDLDECNGRMGVTPEFPNGTYHYFVTDTFPYIQRCLKGKL